MLFFETVLTIVITKKIKDYETNSDFYFSDVISVWAYIAKIRIEELKIAFPDNIEIDYHFVPVFGNAHEKLENGWRDRGGLAGCSNHVKEIGRKFEHTVHPDIWTHDIPYSSLSSYLLLCAVQLLEVKGLVPKSDRVLERTAWAFRETFFTQLANISDRKVQLTIAKQLKLPINTIKATIDSGEAYAQLAKDAELVKEHDVTVSPTLILMKEDKDSTTMLVIASLKPIFASYYIILRENKLGA